MLTLSTILSYEMCLPFVPVSTRSKEFVHLKSLITPKSEKSEKVKSHLKILFWFWQPTVTDYKRNWLGLCAFRFGT